MVNKGQWRTGNEWNYTQNLLVFIFYDDDDDDDKIVTSDFKQIRNKKCDT
jgi:hypothetical protein